MERSEQINELATALAKASAEFGVATKDATNPAFKSKYADLASVMAAVRPALSKHGLSLIQSAATDVEGKTVTVETILLHSSGQHLSGAMTMPVLKWDAQGIGSATTYGRRYLAMAMCGIAPEDDDGEAAGKGEPVKEHRNPPRRQVADDTEREGVLRVWRQEISEAAERGEAALTAVGKRISQQTDWIKQETRADFRAALARAKAVEAEREVEAERAGTNA